MLCLACRDNRNPLFGTEVPWVGLKVQSITGAIFPIWEIFKPKTSVWLFMEQREADLPLELGPVGGQPPEAKQSLTFYYILLHFPRFTPLVLFRPRDPILRARVSGYLT